MSILSALRDLIRPPAAEAFVPSSDPDAAALTEGGFRRMGRSGRRDLDPLAQDQARRVVRYLHDANAFARWLVEMPVNLILGDEIGYSVEINAKRLGLSDDQKAELEDEIKRVLDRFWEHPNLNLRYNADKLATVLRLDGELCLPIASVNEVDGVPALDFLDADLIRAVHPVPGSALVPGSIELAVAPGAPPKSLAIVKLNPETQRLEGECFYFANTSIPNAMRGRPELVGVADWLDTLDGLLFARADRAHFMNYFTMDVTLKSATAAQVKARSAEIRKSPPTPGTFNVHNDSEEWKAVTPDLKSEDATGEVRLLRNYILGSHSIPESWFADGGEATRTTASEQNLIALMALRRLRKRMLTVVGTLLEFAYDSLEAKQPGAFPPRIASGIKLIPDLPPLSEKDVARLGGVIQNIEAALDSAVANERLSARTARKVMLHVVDRLGVSVDPDDERRQVDAEEEDREKRRVDAANAMVRDALRGAPQPAEPQADTPAPSADEARGPRLVSPAAPTNDTTRPVARRRIVGQDAANGSVISILDEAADPGETRS